jgi:hypothetical protein
VFSYRHKIVLNITKIRKEEGAMSKRKANFFRRSHKQIPDWRVIINVLGNGNGFKGLSHVIYFRATGGGEAKIKAFLKIRRFFDTALYDIHGSPRVEVLLEKNPINGMGNGGVPSYILREHSSYFSSIMKARRPSQVFKVK